LADIGEQHRIIQNQNVSDVEFRTAALKTKALRAELESNFPEIVKSMRETAERGAKAAGLNSLSGVNRQSPPAAPKRQPSHADDAARNNITQVLTEKKAVGEVGEVTLRAGETFHESKIKLEAPDQQMQRILTATKASIPLRYLKGMRQAWREAFTYLAPLKGIKELGYSKEFLRESQISESAGGKEAVVDLAGIRGTLSPKESALHGVYIRLKDMEWRALHPDPEKPYKLPEGITLQQVEDMIGFYEPQVKGVQKIVGSTGSLSRHLRAVRGFHSDLVARGVLGPDAQRNPWYFPHEVLDFISPEKGASSSTKSFFNMLKDPVRKYAKSGKSGTERLFEQDYWGAMFRYFKQNRADNIRADYMDKIIEHENRPDLLGMPASRPELEVIPVHRDNFVFRPRIRELPGSDVMRQIESGVLTGDNLKEVARHFNITPKELESIRTGKIDMGVVYLRRALADVLTNEKYWRIGQPGLMRVGQDATRAIKSLLLNINPVRYNVGNIIGDTQNLVRDDPKSILAYPRAAKMLIRSAMGDIHPDMKKGIEMSVADSGKIATEVSDPRKLIEFADIMEVKIQQAMAKRQFAKVLRLIGQLFRGLQGISQGRENIPRMAKFLTDLDRVRAGGEPLNTWSNFEEVKGIMAVDLERAAAKIAREQLIDYGALTPFEVNYLRNGLIPFYTFFRKNTPRWVKYPFVANSWVRAGASPQAQVGRYALSKAAMVAGFGSVYSAVYAWNNVEKKEVEDKLYGWQRDQFHINIGLDEKGNPLTFTAASALDDAMRVVGLDGVSPDMEAAFKGQKTWKEVFNKWYEDGQMFGVPGVGYGVDAITERFTPFLKAPATLVAGIETFPNPREVRIIPKAQRLKAAARGIGMREPIEAVESIQGKRPGQTGKSYLWRYLTTVRTSEPDREAYIDMQNKIRQFKKHKGIGGGYGGGEGALSKYSSSYFRVREAGTPAEIQKAKDEWRQAAKDKHMDFWKSYSASLDRKSPSFNLGRYLPEWKRQATPRELEQYDRAMNYYRETYPQR